MAKKISTIEPAVFKSFAQKVLKGVSDEDDCEDSVRMSARTVGLERTNYDHAPGRVATTSRGNRARD
jgi:hypothetical protein